MKSILPAERIERLIYLIRSKKVMLDMDLADLYEVETGRLNEQVKRNKDRFPEDFMFQLTKDEFNNLKSQFAISSWGGRRTLPYTFTEQGVAMLNAVFVCHGKGDNYEVEESWRVVWVKVKGRFRVKNISLNKREGRLYLYYRYCKI